MDKYVGLIVRTGRNRDIAAVRNDSYFFTGGHSGSEALSEVITFAKNRPSPITVGIDPVPVRMASEGRHESEEDQEYNSTAPDAGIRFIVLARPQIFRKLHCAPEDQEQRPITA